MLHRKDTLLSSGRFRALKSLLCLFSGLCFLAATVQSQVLPVPPAGVVAAAKDGLPGFLAKIPAGAKAVYGFPETSDLSRTRLGTPLALRSVQPAGLENKTAAQTVTEVLSDTSMWFVPVQLEGRIKAMLVVDWHEGAWRAVSLGYAPLAGEWDQVAAQWPAEKGYHPQLVTFFQGKQFYFTVPEVDGTNFTAIASPGNASSGPASPTGDAGKEVGRYARLGSVGAELPHLKEVLNKQRAEPKPQN